MSAPESINGKTINKISCPKCKSNWVIKDGNENTKYNGTVQRFRCRSCEKRFRAEGDYLVRSLSDLEKQLIKAGYNGSKTTAQIAEMLPAKRAKTTIIRYLERIGLKTLQHRPEFKFHPAEKELGGLIGAVAGDGYIDLTRNVVCIYPNQNETAYAQYLSNIILKLFDKRPNIWHDKNKHTLQIRTGGKQLIAILKNYLYFEDKNKTKTVKLIKPVYSYSTEFLKGFVGNLISTDGCVGYRSGTPYIKFDSSSIELAKQYAAALNRLGIKNNIYHSIRKTTFIERSEMYSVVSYGFDNVSRFCYKVGIPEPNKLHKLQGIIMYRTKIPNGFIFS